MYHSFYRQCFRLLLIFGTVLGISLVGGCDEDTDPIDIDADADSTIDVDGDVDNNIDSGQTDADSDLDNDSDPLPVLGGPCEDRFDCVQPPEENMQQANCNLEAHGYPGGMCTWNNCMEEGCPSATDYSCVQFADDSSFCYLRCSTDDECRDGYICNSRNFCSPGCRSQADCPEDRVCTGTTTPGFCYNPNSQPYDPCVTSSDCRNDQDWRCVTEKLDGWPGGMCVHFAINACSINPTSPGEGICAAHPETGIPGACMDDQDSDPDGYCFQGCITDDDCRHNGARREGYVCQPVGAGGKGACIPDCNTASVPDSVCTDGRVCTQGKCYLPLDDNEIGAACALDYGCKTGRCLSERTYQYPFGYCVRPCKVNNDGTDDCGTKGVCMEGNCYRTCRGSNDCRQGYSCYQYTSSGIQVCLPKCNEGDTCEIQGNICNTSRDRCVPEFDIQRSGFGGECYANEGCQGGYCYTQESSGLPRGLCVYIGCELGSSCGEGAGVCLDVSSQGYCFPACDPTLSPEDPNYGCSRLGYECFPDGPGGSGYCWAKCRDDADCSFGLQVCTPTGKCNVPFLEADLGASCTSGYDCIGGKCLKESSGYPGGLCIYEGCNETISCPNGGVCVSPSVSYDGLGICYPRCTDVSDCRAGYKCEPAVQGQSDKFCQPDCTTTTGCIQETCNETTGYCNDPPGRAGDACNDASQCTASNAMCLGTTEGYTADGYCSAACDALQPLTSCSPSGVCYNGYCHGTCLIDIDCRAGYTCQYQQGILGLKICLP